MAAIGKYGRLMLGDALNTFVAQVSGITTQSLAAANTNGTAIRFTAHDTRYVTGCWIHFSSVSSPGSNGIRVRLESIDATTGKPNGVVGSATASQTAAAGWNNFTWADTTALTAGTEYAITIISTVAGTTQTLNAYTTSSALVPNLLPSTVFTTTDGGTTWNELTYAGTGVLSITFSDGAEEAEQFYPFPVASSFSLYGTRSAGFSLTISVPMVVAGAYFGGVFRTGTPTGDLRLRVYTAAGSLVSGTSRTIDKDSLTNLGGTGRSFRIYFDAPVTLAAGQYSFLLDQTDHASTSSNYFSLRYMTARAATLVPSGNVLTTTTNIDSSQITTNDTSSFPCGFALIDDIPAVSGGGLACNPIGGFVA